MIDPAEIRAYRERHGLSQAQFGSLVGVGQSAISFWERGERQPYPKTELALLALLGYPGAEVIREAAPTADAAPWWYRKQLAELPRRWRARREDSLARLRAKPGAPLRTEPCSRELNLEADCWYRAARELEEALQLPEETA